MLWHSIKTNLRLNRLNKNKIKQVDTNALGEAIVKH
jgi:hypothetical protein